MENFYWRQPQRKVGSIEEIKGLDEIEWLDRFPEGAHGREKWREYWSDYIPTEENRIPFGYTWLFDPNLFTNNKTPRVFISHRQADETEAVDIANRAWKAGFNYWLDVFDPNLQSLNKLLANGNSSLSKVQECFAIASIIEMGLINCSHVLVVYTRNTKGSNWIPYEYGRVKNSPVITVQAASWVERSININSGKRFPEYMHLGKIIQHRNDINDRNNPYYYLEKWFKDELGKWNNHP